MKKLLFALLFFLFFLQFSFLPMVFSVGNVNLLLCLVVVFSLYYSFSENIVLTILSGLLLDWFSLASFGTGLLAILMLSYLLDLSRNKILPNKIGVVMGALVFLIAKVSFDFLQYSLAGIFRYYKLLPKNTLEGGFWQPGHYGWETAIFIVAGLIILKIVDRLDRTIGKGKTELRVSTQ